MAFGSTLRILGLGFILKDKNGKNVTDICYNKYNFVANDNEIKGEFIINGDYIEMIAENNRAHVIDRDGHVLGLDFLPTSNGYFSIISFLNSFSVIMNISFLIKNI